jgi:hypothetical protein
VVGNGLIGGNMDVSGALEVVGNGLIGGNMDVSGALEVVGDGLIGGNLDVSGALEVVGSAVIGGDLDISGNIDIAGDVDVSGDVRSNNGLSTLSTNAVDVGTCEIYSKTGDGVGPQFQSYKSRGGSGAVQSGDQLGILNFFGMDAGTTYGFASAQIRANAAEAFTGATNHATALTFAVRNAGDTAITDRMTIQSSGAVDITSSKLQIFGDTGATNPVIAICNSRSGGVQAAEELGRLLFIGRAADNSYPFATARISGYSDIAGPTLGNHPGSLTFWTTPANSVNNVERMRVTSIGDVGIGTTAPTQLLDVNGGGRIGATLYVGGSTTTNEIRFNGTFGDGAGSYDHTILSERIYGGAEDSELLVYKGNDLNDRIRLKSSTIRFQTGVDTNVANYTLDSTGYTTVLDASGNLTVPGTIAAGAITFGFQSV